MSIYMYLYVFIYITPLLLLFPRFISNNMLLSYARYHYMRYIFLRKFFVYRLNLFLIIVFGINISVVAKSLFSKRDKYLIISNTWSEYIKFQ
jgi:hypothetical protein